MIFIARQKQGLRGQALLMVVLVMVIALTVGLSIAARTTTSIRTSTEDANSQKAFSAAEAGIEQSLQSGASSVSDIPIGSAKYSTQVVNSTATAFLVSNGATILKDDPVDVWLSTYPTFVGPWSGTLVINWGTSGESCNTNEAVNTQAALRIVLITTTTPAAPKTNNKINSYAFDPCGPALRRGGNNFQAVTTPGDTINGKSFAYKVSLPNMVSPTAGLVVRILPLYASTVIGVGNGGGNPLPSQGTVVTSTGTSDNTQRKIVSFRGYPKLPVELFPFILFSPK